MDISQKKKYRIPRIQSTELNVNKAKDPSEDASISLGKEKKTEGRKKLSGRGEGEGQGESLT